MSNTAVGVFVLAVFAIIVVFDVALLLDGKKSNTISANARRLGSKWPPFRLLVSFGCGLVLGHLWWT